MRNENTKTVDNATFSRRNMPLGGTTIAAVTALAAATPVRTAQAEPKQQPKQQPAPAAGKLNILVIWGDDIGISNISLYSGGLVGHETPTIDRIGREGLKLQHYKGERHAWCREVQSAKHPRRADRCRVPGHGGAHGACAGAGGRSAAVLE